jgi:exodeoxyribonuclease VII small subunit
MTESEQQKLSFEQALNQLEKIVQTFEAGQSNLEQTLANYKEALKLRDICQKKLDNAKLEINQINADNSVSEFNNEN